MAIYYIRSNTTTGDYSLNVCPNMPPSAFMRKLNDFDHAKLKGFDLRLPVGIKGFKVPARFWADKSIRDTLSHECDADGNGLREWPCRG